MGNLLTILFYALWKLFTQKDPAAPPPPIYPPLEDTLPTMQALPVGSITLYRRDGIPTTENIETEFCIRNGKIYQKAKSKWILLEDVVGISYFP